MDRNNIWVEQKQKHINELKQKKEAKINQKEKMAAQKLEFPKNSKIKADSKVKMFIDTYEEKLSNPKVSYLPYSWELNK